MAFKRFSDLGGEYEVEPKSKDVIGFDVFDKDGNKIGVVDDLLVNTDNDAINYALVGQGWFASTFGDKDVIVPLRKMDIDDADRSVHLDMTQDQLKDFPGYNTLDDPDLLQKVDSFWGGTMYQRPIEGRERLGRPITIPVTEEKANVQKEMEKTGEVKVTMEEETTRQPISEEVRGEKVEVERHKISDQPLAEYEKTHQAREVQPGETISVPVTEERIRITKEPVVVEEITLRKVPTERRVTAEEELHKEHVEVKEEKPTREEPAA